MNPTPTRERPIFVRLLGPIDAEVSTVAVHLGGSRQRRLLALLALRAGHRVDVSEVIDVVWVDDELPSDPRETLS